MAEDAVPPVRLQRECPICGEPHNMLGSLCVSCRILGFLREKRLEDDARQADVARRFAVL